MNESDLLYTLRELFDVPPDIKPATDLREYIKDSIDVGELVATLNESYQLDLKLIDFKEVYTYADLKALLVAS